MKETLIKLTDELYRLTLLFPKKEPLRYQMRQLANEILAECLTLGNKRESSVFGKLEVLDSFFEVAKSQNWVKPVELLRLQEQYDRIRAELKKNQKKIQETSAFQAPSASPTVQRTPAPSVGQASSDEKSLSEREARILEFLRQNGRAQVGQLKKYFPNVTKRTLRRDFRRLLRKGMIERLGERNETYYRIKE